MNGSADLSPESVRAAVKADKRKRLPMKVTHYLWFVAAIAALGLQLFAFGQDLTMLVFFGSFGLIAPFGLLDAYVSERFRRANPLCVPKELDLPLPLAMLGTIFLSAVFAALVTGITVGARIVFPLL